MEQGLVPDSWLNRRVALLEQDAARRAAYEEPNYQWNFRVALTCPTTTTVHIRGGQVWGDPQKENGYQWYVEDLTCDMADEDDTDYSYTFTNAYYYKPMALHIRYSGSPEYLVVPGNFWFYINPSTGEFSEAGAAEMDVYPAWTGGNYLADSDLGIPVGIYIMRNNGNTTEANQFMPIDRVNRGRSYLFRELSMRFLL